MTILPFALCAAVLVPSQSAPPVAEIAVPVEAAAPAPPVAASGAIDLAICLDTSGSMNGLIDAARQKIWAIVNDLALADPAPDLRVALLTYGNNGHPAEEGWVKVETDFTVDLDLVSQILFSYVTNGGEEYVGRVVHKASQLGWRSDPGGLRIMLVAGNESADQDQDVSFRDACRGAIGRDIMVNAIYCGNPADDIAPGWREVAQLADGQFASIDQNDGTVVVATPFDEQIAALGTAVNGTYITYTTTAWVNQARQTMQDENAEKLNSEAAAQRAMAKCSTNYCNAQWDLVDAAAQEGFDWTTIEDEALPEAMRTMTLDERKAYVAAKAKERAEIQKQVQDLSKQREAFVAEEMKKQALDDSRSFDRVIRDAIRAQARSRGYGFKE